MRALLDINVLVSLFDSDHIQHDLARAWLVANAGDGWASCPITENGFVRIISQPAYPGSITPRHAMALLEAARRHDAHEFWAADVSLLDAVDPSRIHGPKQLTDVYLLALAARHGGRFVTFDGRIPVAAVPAAGPAHLVVLASRLGTDAVTTPTEGEVRR